MISSKAELEEIENMNSTQNFDISSFFQMPTHFTPPSNHAIIISSNETQNPPYQVTFSDSDSCGFTKLNKLPSDDLKNNDDRKRALEGTGNRNSGILSKKSKTGDEEEEVKGKSNGNPPSDDGDSIVTIGNIPSLLTTPLSTSTPYTNNSRQDPNVQNYMLGNGYYSNMSNYIQQINNYPQVQGIHSDGRFDYHVYNFNAIISSMPSSYPPPFDRIPALVQNMANFNNGGNQVFLKDSRITSFEKSNDSGVTSDTSSNNTPDSIISSKLASLVATCPQGWTFFSKGLKLK